MRHVFPYWRGKPLSGGSGNPGNSPLAVKTATKTWLCLGDRQRKGSPQKEQSVGGRSGRRTPGVHRGLSHDEVHFGFSAIVRN